MDSIDALSYPDAPGAREAGPVAGTASSPASGVTALYRAHAMGLVRLAVIMLGDQGAAEDVVQEAFLGLYRHWGRLSDPARALPYLRTSVLNGSRDVLRRRRRRGGPAAPLSAAEGLAPLESAEAWALLGEEHREVLTGLKRLPARQREALVLRFYLDMSDEEIARTMAISRGTVKSATSRGIAALGRLLREEGAR